jgi:hypothetical protein
VRYTGTATTEGAAGAAGYNELRRFLRQHVVPLDATGRPAGAMTSANNFDRFVCADCAIDEDCCCAVIQSSVHGVHVKKCVLAVLCSGGVVEIVRSTKTGVVVVLLTRQPEGVRCDDVVCGYCIA